jgi:hypothetical protein
LPFGDFTEDGDLGEGGAEVIVHIGGDPGKLFTTHFAGRARSSSAPPYPPKWDRQHGIRLIAVS